MLDVPDIKTIFCWKFGTQWIRFLTVQGTYACKQFLSELGL